MDIVFLNLRMYNYVKRVARGLGMFLFNKEDVYIGYSLKEFTQIKNL